MPEAPSDPPKPDLHMPDTSEPDTSEPDAPRERGVRLDHFLQRAGVAQTGGHAKLLIQGGEVLLNGVVETRRRKQLFSGDVISCGGETFELE